MTDIRITQLGIEVLSYQPAEQVRITQMGTDVLVNVLAATIRCTIMGIEALCEAYPCLTYLAQCWKITRQDGTVFAYTAHDLPLTYGGVTYSPCDSLNAAANELGAQLGSIGNTEINGIISDDGISEADIVAGLFDLAEVEIWMIPWGTGSERPWRLTKGLITKTTHGRGDYQMEVLTPGARLTQKALLTTVGPSCRYDLGDSGCGVDLYAYQVAGEVSALATLNASLSSSQRIFFDDTRTEDESYFDEGVIEWLTGANAGQTSEVKDYLASGQMTLWDPMPYPIEIGDTYTITPGCDKAFDGDCASKFDNRTNFGGFPHLPGQDAISATPEAKNS